MYIRQHPENTRVGANCNSPFHMGEFVIWAKYNVGELGSGRIATWMNFATWMNLQYG